MSEWLPDPDEDRQGRADLLPRGQAGCDPRLGGIRVPGVRLRIVAAAICPAGREGVERPRGADGTVLGAAVSADARWGGITCRNEPNLPATPDSLNPAIRCPFPPRATAARARSTIAHALPALQEDANSNARV